MKASIITLSMALTVLASCTTYAPFNQHIRDQYKLTPEELSSIQFYTSDAIILRRGEKGKAKTTAYGTLKLKSGENVEEVVIPAGTPCVVEKVIDNERMAMRFGDEKDEFLVFGSLRQQDGYYTLQALDWVKGRGKVSYGDQYYFSNPGSNNVFLTIELKHLREYKRETKTVGGQRVR